MPQASLSASIVAPAASRWSGIADRRPPATLRAPAMRYDRTAGQAVERAGQTGERKQPVLEQPQVEHRLFGPVQP